MRKIRGNRGGRGGLVFFLFFGFAALYFRRFLLACGSHCSGGSFGFKIDKPVDQIIDLELVFFDLARQCQNFRDGRGTRGNGLNHVLQAFFDTLGDLDFFLAREQIHRAHFAHVHTHRIGGTTKFRIDRGERGLGFFRRVFIRHRRSGIGHDHGFRIGRDIAHLDTHIIDHAGHAFDLLHFEHIRKMVVDFSVSQIAALLTQDDQRLEPGAARLEIQLRIHHGFRDRDERLLV